MSGSPEQHAQLQHLRNLAYFYNGIIHLLYHQPYQAVQALRAVQPPMTTTGTHNRALFLALAYRHLQQPDTAERAVQVLTRAAALPDPLRGPSAVVCAGVANLRQTMAAVGASLDTALAASLEPRTVWEPSWRALLYQELGVAMQRLGYREAAVACYEEGLKVVAYRTGHWYDPRHSGWLRGHSLLAALENLPWHTWSAALQGEMIQLLQGLAWLYGHSQHGTLADLALTLALRLATTPAQQACLWLHRGWLAATASPVGQPDATASSPLCVEVLLGIQRARACEASAPLTQALRGMEALLQGHETLAQACFDAVPVVPEAPGVQALCVAAWLWAHTRQGTLAQALHAAQRSTPPPWHTDMALADALEMLLAWTTDTAIPAAAAVVAWLAPLLAQQGPRLMPVLQVLCRPDYLPKAQQTTLTAALTTLLNRTEDVTLADQVAALLGGRVLLARIDAWLAQLEQSLAPTPVPGRPAPKYRKRRQPHHSPAPGSRITDVARVLHLIRVLEDAGSPATHSAPPETIRDWLVHYPQLAERAPEVVGALLRLLRQCPNAHAMMQSVLEQVALSRRQRQALEAALQTSPAASDTAPSPLAWEPMRSWPLARLLEALQGRSQQHGPLSDRAVPARTWYIMAVVLARAGMLNRAADCLRTCLRLQPEAPLAHFMLAQILRLQQQYAAAQRHILQAWHALQVQSLQAQVVHLEILNQLLMILGATQQYDRFAEWVATFEQMHAVVATASLSDDQRQRLREEEGDFALARALFLVSAAAGNRTMELLEQQLDLLAQAIDKGSPSTRHLALHRQAETLARLQRHADAAAAYSGILQQWPDDQGARLRLALLTAVRQATEDVAGAERALAEALSLAFAGMRPNTTPSPLTPQTALRWLQQATPRDPHYRDVTDVLTAYGGLAVRQGDLVRAIATLTALDTLVAQPQQAYYLAEAYYARSQQPASVTDRLQDCERALQYAARASQSETHRQHASLLLQQIQADHQRLVAAERHAAVRIDYRRRVCHLFARYGVPFQEEEADPAPDAAWLAMHEMVDLDEASGNPIATIRLCFYPKASSPEPQPSEQDITLYVQHQREVQRLVETHGMAALPWAPTAYTGDTAFDLIFPERLALNRDLLFVVHAERPALLRYARVLQQLSHTLPTLLAAASSPAVPGLVAAARYITMIALLQQRLQTLATGIHSKTQQRQISAYQEEVSPALLERLQTFPPFVDAYAYFQAVAGALHPLLNALTLEPVRLPEKRELPEHARRQRGRQRHAKILRHAG
jgi:tetratricopeptide (TPR) repeat protein